ELLSPTRRVREDGQRLDFAAERLRNILSRRLQHWQTRLERGEARLQSLSPLAVLKRGYGLVRTPEGRVIESIQSLKAGDALRISLADGVVDAQVEGVQSARKAP
ncbi:MAG: exodeoxyribonuclease VII large subunit, partial [Planctomycetes bacterium]|nr:exodeoxyribonuclease VII large subunit [Planctomycetota bacterium]